MGYYFSLQGPDSLMSTEGVLFPWGRREHMHTGERKASNKTLQDAAKRPICSP